MDGEDFMTDQQAKFDDDFEEEIYDEDKYDALNDETFGNDMSDGDWEADHEKYAKYDEVIKKKWPDGTEVNDYLANSIPPDPNVFTESLKTLPDLERELRQLHTFSHQYEVPPLPLPFQYQNNFNFVNQNYGINLPSNNCGPIRRPIPVQGSNPIPHIDAVKVSPSYNRPVPEVNQGYLPFSPYYKREIPQYNLPNVRVVPKNFPRNNNNVPRNLINNVKRFNTNMAYQNFPKMKNYTFDEQSDFTDYGAGFMTVREKHWLAGIQTIQFHNSNPLEEDYYFTMYQKRHHGSSGPKPNSNFHQPDTQSRFNNSYTQLHFENSLGKVLIGSVITPRKMIDIETNDFAPSSASSTDRAVVAQKNSKQILLEIEHMYIPLLKIEQTYYAIRNKAQAAPTVQQYIDELTEILSNHLHHLVSYVTIRKGKQLVHRILPHLKNPSFLWSVFFGPSICTIISKDNEDQLLLLFLPYIRQWIFCLYLPELNQIAEYLMKNLAFVLISIFGISVIANMIERAEEVRPTTERKVLKQWSIFISNVILVGSENTIQRPVIGLDKKIIEQHLTYLPLDQSVTIEKKLNLVQRISFLGDTTKK
ncbi:protein PAT1 homolog 1 isoform X3 [Acyrthosiphon pisum]|uniref:mRNA decay factor PAT1 domain-containing protein n=1 Tax=Acyrthosiphon pisum TaxID=7029 RepID=A0A8R2B4V7_ACYPI|nr:protein PAT1 homolog 1 isoform X3 [Acyrthosiphon pisum]|eukprot:XP_008181887.1 PREDICTED: protein PAT1 homolog 1 isoform X3 [Acyrthosiphon pisum]